MRLAFRRYLALGSLLPVVRELAAAGHATRAGRPFTRTGVYQLLTNPTSAGKVRYQAEVHAGTHEPLVDGRSRTEQTGERLTTVNTVPRRL